MSWSWSCYFGLGLGLVSSGLGLGLKNCGLVCITGVWVCTGDRNDLTLGTVAILNTMLQLTDFGFKGARVSVRV